MTRVQDPKISIILPIRNEAASIRPCLDAILAQDYAGQMEILVADGMSTDDTRNILAAYQQLFPQIRMIENPGKIVPTGINSAIRQASGEIIVRVDGHTLIAPDYVTRCVETLQRTGADNAGGRMTAVGVTNFGNAVALATSTPFGIGNSKFHYASLEQETDSVYMGAWPKAVFERIGLFDEELVRDQDDEFNYRLREKGGRIYLNPAIQSVYTTRSSLKSLWKQYYQYGLWKVRVLQKHPAQMSVRQFIPPAFVLGLLISLVLTMTSPWGKWLLLLSAGSYLLANISATFITAAKNGWKYTLMLPLVFLTIHVGYGLGFLAGLVKFLNRWGDKTGKTPPWSHSHE